MAFFLPLIRRGEGARGIAQSAVSRGEDVDVSNIEGIVEFTQGKVSVLQVPSIGKGGSGAD